MHSMSISDMFALGLLSGICFGHGIVAAERSDPSKSKASATCKEACELLYNMHAIGDSLFLASVGTENRKRGHRMGNGS